MYCAFVDFMKAFNTGWRAGLWHKMLPSNINGKMNDVIFNMYCNIKSCIVFNKCKSDCFACNNGVRERPFNLKGEGGGYGFFLKKIF